VTTCAWIRPSTRLAEPRAIARSRRQSLRRGAPGARLDRLAAASWQNAIAGSRADLARLRAPTVTICGGAAKPPAARSRAIAARSK
jgi:hypothetical protein